MAAAMASPSAGERLCYGCCASQESINILRSLQMEVSSRRRVSEDANSSGLFKCAAPAFDSV